MSYRICSQHMGNRQQCVSRQRYWRIARNSLLAQDIKSGAGQYFTPRPLIQAMIDVMRPEPDQTICDPAAGTGGFLIAAHDYITQNYPLNRTQYHHLNHEALHGWEIVDNTARLCVMNLYLHCIGSTALAYCGEP